MAENENKDEKAVEETTPAAEETKETPTPPEAEKQDSKPKTPSRKRAEKVGVVFSDKMEKTVVVRVDRTVKHPLYHKYMKKRKKFMAHDEMGATEGDKVRIVETRPLSARKRWRVVEIIQRAQR